ALIMGWVQMGRRVMIAVIGLQVLIGVIVAAWAGAAHHVLPSNLWVHIVGGLLAMFAYIAGRRLDDRGNRGAALLLSLIGFVLVLFTAWYGANLTTHQPV